jgi:hypothetical protein
MSAPEVVLTTDGAEWTATLAGIDGLEAQSATATTAEDAAAAVRIVAQAACLAAAAAQGLVVGPVQLAALELRLRQACSLAVAALTPAAVPPVADPYGTDISTFPDLGPYLALVSGPRAVAEAVARRLLTATGLLDHAPNAGMDVRELIGQGFTPARLAALQARIQNEAEGDERVASATVNLELDEHLEAMTIEVQIALIGGETFKLVLTVTQLASNLSVLDT